MVGGADLPGLPGRPGGLPTEPDYFRLDMLIVRFAWLFSAVGFFLSFAFGGHFFVSLERDRLLDSLRRAGLRIGLKRHAALPRCFSTRFVSPGLGFRLGVQEGGAQQNTSGGE